MSRYAYTAAAVVLLVLLTATHWKVYHLGRTLKQAEYNQAVAAATERARAREQALVVAKHEIEVRYADLKKRTAAAAAGAQSELDRLRGDLAARGPGQGASPGARVDGGPERELLGACAASLVSMAGEADRIAAQLIGLQGYVQGVCLKP